MPPLLADKNEFNFESRNDGVCWLKVGVITRQGKQEPENIFDAPPKPKIAIDTIKPVVRALTAQRQGEDVVAAWEILEDHFDPKGFHLEYQPKDNPSSGRRCQPHRAWLVSTIFGPPVPVLLCSV